MKSSVISLGLFNHTGGPTKTVSYFRQALDASLFAFCEQSTLRKHKLSVEEAYPVISSSLPVLSEFCYTKKGTKKAEKAVAASTLVSCHGFYRYHALWTRKACVSASVPYWFVPHGILDPWVMKKNRWMKQLYWKLGGHRFLQEASTVIFSTAAERDKAASQFDLPGAEVLYWPVELVDLSKREEARDQIRTKLGIPQDAYVLLYFGRLHPMKRPLQTIEAFAKSNTTDMHLLIVGNEDGITKVDCMNLARRLGVEKRMHFIGPIYGDRKYDYMFTCDAYISLSHRENFNYTAVESLAAGLPVILSPGNDLRSELSGVSCCLNVKDNSLDSATKAIKAFNDLSLSTLQDRGLSGRQWVEENLSFDRFKANLLNLHSKFAK